MLKGTIINNLDLLNITIDKLFKYITNDIKILYLKFFFYLSVICIIVLYI